MEPLEEEDMKIEISELPLSQDYRETVEYIKSLVQDSRTTASKAHEICQLISLPGINFLWTNNKISRSLCDLANDF